MQHKRIILRWIALSLILLSVLACHSACRAQRRAAKAQNAHTACPGPHSSGQARRTEHDGEP